MEAREEMQRLRILKRKKKKKNIDLNYYPIGYAKLRMYIHSQFRLFNKLSKCVLKHRK